MPKRANDMANAPLLQFPYDFRWKSQGVIPSSGIHQSPWLYCLVVEANWLKDINGAISRLDEWDAWKGTEQEIEDARGQILLLQSRIQACMILRQNPDNPCQLQQSNDFGQTWTLAFDYSLCVPPSQSIIVNDILIENLQDLINAYSDALDDIEALFPDLEYDGTGQDVTRDLALCFALQKFVELVCAVAIDGLQDKSLLIVGAGTGLAITGLVIGIFTVFFPVVTLALIAMSAIAIQIYGASVGNDVADYQDAGAIEEVYCCMFNNLRDQVTGDAVQAAAFADALAGCSFTGNAEKIAEVVQIALNDTDSYLTFMNFWNAALEQSQAGVLPDCECIPEFPLLVPMLDGEFCSETSTENYDITDHMDGTWTILTEPSGADDRFMVKDQYNRAIKLTEVIGHTSGLSRRVWQNADTLNCGNIGAGYPIDEPILFLGFTWSTGAQKTATLRFELV